MFKKSNNKSNVYECTNIYAEKVSNLVHFNCFQQIPLDILSDRRQNLSGFFKLVPTVLTGDKIWEPLKQVLGKYLANE